MLQLPRPRVKTTTFYLLLLPARQIEKKEKEKQNTEKSGKGTLNGYSVREDEFKANCRVCKRQFLVSHGGLTDVKQHASGEAHKKNETQRRSQGALTQFLVRQATPEANMVCQITKHVYCMLVVA
ncbi:unnamed protein product [Arctogadus glacialis]